jgi:polyphenol oxidase
MDVIRSTLLGRFENVVFGISTRYGGVSSHPYHLNLSKSVGDDRENVRRNRDIFFGALGIDFARAAYPLQVHSSNIAYADTPGRYPDTDGLATDKNEVYLIVTVADCLPVFLYDPVHHAVAGVHAGWKGTSRHITRKMIRMMAARWGTRPSDLVAYLGPSAGVCCYEVGREVARLFPPERLVAKTGGKYHLDIPAVNRTELLAEGVREDRIEHENSCTICTPDRFHSYRRDGERSGRMMGVIGLIGERYVEKRTEAI